LKFILWAGVILGFQMFCLKTRGVRPTNTTKS
jgi:hypothetical protein